MLTIPSKHKSLIFSYLIQLLAIYPDYQILSFEVTSLNYVFLPKITILVW